MQIAVGSEDGHREDTACATNMHLPERVGDPRAEIIPFMDCVASVPQSSKMLLSELLVFS